MDKLQLIGQSMELFSLLLYAFASYYSFRIGLVTKGFGKIWSVISLAFIFIILRRTIHLFSPYLPPDLELFSVTLIIPIMMMVIGVMFMWAFYRLHSMIESIPKNKGKKS